MHILAKKDSSQREIGRESEKMRSILFFLILIAVVVCQEAERKKGLSKGLRNIKIFENFLRFLLY